MQKGGWRSFLSCPGLWLRKRTSKEQQASAPGRRAASARELGFCSQSKYFSGRSLTTRRGQRAPRCASRVEGSIRAGKNEAIASTFICQTSRHLGHTEVREGKITEPQNSTALRGQDDNIMALCMVADTGDSFITLRRSAWEAGCFHSFSVSSSSCLPPVNVYIVAYLTSILDVLPRRVPPRTAQPRGSGTAARLSLRRAGTAPPRETLAAPAGPT